MTKGVSCNFFYWYIKNEWYNVFQRNRELILNRSKVYYEKDKERLREQVKDKYRNLSEKGKKLKERIWKK